MIKAVIFDLDGLLVDSEIVAYKIYKEMLNEFEYNFSIEEYAKNFSGKTLINNITYLINTYNLPLDINIALEKVLEIENKFIEEGIELKAGAKELLSYLKSNSYKIALASSSIKDRALTILKQNNIIEYFDDFVFGYEVEKGKPYPDIFLKACEKLSESPENCLVLEDSEAGIQAAYSANIPVICVPDMKVPTQKYLDMTKAVLNSLEEVISYL